MVESLRVDPGKEGVFVKDCNNTNQVTRPDRVLI